jgi:putative redox protein
MEAIVNWKAGLSFEGVSNGHTVAIDTTVAGGGANTGMSPKQMLLASLCACSGMDVVEIIQKMRVQFTQLQIVAEAEQTDTHPKVFKYINMKYRADVSADDVEKLEKAIVLSHEKYCGISAMLSKHCTISHTIEILI